MLSILNGKRHAKSLKNKMCLYISWLKEIDDKVIICLLEKKTADNDNYF